MSVRVELRRDAGKLDPGAVWIRQRQVARVLGPPDPASVAALVDHRGHVLGHGLYSPDSQIVLRLLSRGDAPPAPDWLARRLTAALDGRAALGFGVGFGATTTGYREVNSEGDGIPGLVVDRFGDWRVAQITTAPIAARRTELTSWLQEHAPLPGGLIVLAPETAAARERFEAGIEIVAADGSRQPPSALTWLEHGASFRAPAPPSQKTGAYHDQRDNRLRFAELLRPGARVLDLGCHVGGFAIAAARGGASVVAVDQSAPVLDCVADNAAVNGVGERIATLTADMFGPLDQAALAGPFDAIVFDPPKIATGRRDLPRASAAMTRTLGRLTARLHPGGIVAVCSCSQHLGWTELDQQALDIGGLTRVARWGAGLDHPIAPGHLEGEYLRVAVYQRRA